MADFSVAYKRTGVFEGGYSCEEPDNGNWTGGKVGVGNLVGTICGITAYEVKDYLGKEPTVDMVKYFPENARKDIYRKKYWDIVRGDEIENQDIANQLYDEQVNAGGNGVKLAYQIAGLEPKLKISDELIKTLNS